MAVSGIFTALSGMNAHRRILDTTAHNVANQLTPGYRRQVVDLAPASVGTGPQVWAGSGSDLNGVEITDTRRVIDRMAEARAQRSVATAVDATTTHDVMLRLEDVFGEPNAGGIADRLDSFHTSFSDLADRADDSVARGTVLSNAQNLVDRFGQIASDLDEISRTTGTRLVSLADEVNLIASQVADLNRSIAASPETPNNLLDQRDILTSRLATLTGSETRPTDRNQVAVTLSGRLLVGNGIAYEVEVDGSGLAWTADGDAVTPGPSELAAIGRLIDTTIPDLMTEVDGLVAGLVAEVNAAHSQGFGLDGVDGRNFFDPAGTTAATMALSADVAGQPDNIGAGGPVLPGPTAPGIFDGRQAQLLGDLAVDGTTTSDYRSLIADFGIRTSSSAQRAVTAQQIADGALNDAESISGVSLDEEMTTMMAAQRGYEASARVLSAVDEMLQTIIGLIR